jgi:hypothetical protein
MVTIASKFIQSKSTTTSPHGVTTLKKTLYTAGVRTENLM